MNVDVMLNRQVILVRTAKDLGEVVRAARVAAGLRQAEAAALCGVSAPFLNGLERGKATVQLGLTLTVCAGLGVEVRLALPSDAPPVADVPKRKPRARKAASR